MATQKPHNRIAELRTAPDWPTGRAKARWRKQNRSKIARHAQRERDREASRAG